MGAIVIKNRNGFICLPCCVVLVFQLAGCTANYTRQVWNESLASVSLADEHYQNRSAQWVIHPRTRLCINPAKNDSQQERRRALAALNQSIETSFHQSFSSVKQYESSLSLTAAFQAAQSHGCELLVYPVLVELNNNINTRQELNYGKDLQPNKTTGRDNIRLNMQIYEVRTRQLLDIAKLVGHQRMLASNDSSPHDLFDQALQLYLFSITGRSNG